MEKSPGEDSHCRTKKAPSWVPCLRRRTSASIREIFPRYLQSSNNWHENWRKDLLMHVIWLFIEQTKARNIEYICIYGHNQSLSSQAIIVRWGWVGICWHINIMKIFSIPWFYINLGKSRIVCSLPHPIGKHLRDPMAVINLQRVGPSTSPSSYQFQSMAVRILAQAGTLHNNSLSDSPLYGLVTGAQTVCIKRPRQNKPDRCMTVFG